MAWKEASTGKASPSRLGVPEFAAMATKGLEQFAEARSEFMEDIREANQKCLYRMELEAALASEFVSKLTASHSITDTAVAYQKWGKRRMELFAEDSRSFMADSQKFMEKATRLLSKGSHSINQTDGST